MERQHTVGWGSRAWGVGERQHAVTVGGRGQSRAWGVCFMQCFVWSVHVLLHVGTTVCLSDRVKFVGRLWVEQECNAAVKGA
jgi:hypothetical protein